MTSLRYPDAAWRAAALLHTIVRLEPLPRRNGLFAAFVAAQCMDQSRLRHVQSRHLFGQGRSSGRRRGTDQVATIGRLFRTSRQVNFHAPATLRSFAS